MREDFRKQSRTKQLIIHSVIISGFFLLISLEIFEHLFRYNTKPMITEA